MKTAAEGQCNARVTSLDVMSIPKLKPPSLNKSGLDITKFLANKVVLGYQLTVFEVSLCPER